MLDFQLFRIKVLPALQPTLFDFKKSPSEILRESIYSHPSVELRKGVFWHIGNITTLDKWGIYFRVGKSKKTTFETFKEGNFSDEVFETAPYTHVILDTNLELCAIAQKHKLSQKTIGIARQLARILIESELAQQLNATFEIDDIKDPEKFIEYLRSAYSISKFWVTFSRPNAFDSNKDFIQPMEKLLNESRGEKGKTQIQGESLTNTLLENLTRSAAATGNDASATLKLGDDQEAVHKRLKGNPIIISQADLTDNNQKNKLLNTVREIYKKIRGRTNSNGK